MSRKKKESAASEVLEELESLGDRLARSVSENPARVLGAALAILLLAGGYGLLASFRSNALDRASGDLAQAEADFRATLGVPEDSLQIVEPANPETARRARADFIERFQKVADDHSGTPPGAIARLELGVLQEALGEPEKALESWRRALEEISADEPTWALIQLQVAAAHEAAGLWLEAAKAYEAAAAVDRYPLRYVALADAARCYATAGDTANAIETFERIEVEAPDERIPDHIRARIAELRARRDAEPNSGEPS